jgi:hypothetical protein
MFQEIINTTHANPSSCDAFERVIFARLRKSQPNIKWKCLMVIKHVTPKANQSFKRCMQDHVGDIKACLQFRGPPHPTYGDSLYKRVREEAKSALESIFQDAPRQSNPRANLQGRIQGIGGGSGGSNGAPRFGSNISSNAQAALAANMSNASTRGHSGGRQGTSSMGNVGSANAAIAYGGMNGRKMQGFGNPNFNNEPKKESYFDKMKEKALNKAKELATGQKAPGPKFANGGNPAWMNNATGAATYNYANNRGAGSAAVGSGGGYSGPNRPAVVVVGRDALNSPGGARGRSASFERKKGQVGGVWGNQSSNVTSFGTSGASTTSFDRRDSARSGNAGLASKDGVYEQTLVDSICSSGGLRPVPNAKEVGAFVNRCKNLDATIVGGLIVAKLDVEDWKVNLKALVIMEAMANDPSFAKYADFFYDEKEALEDLLEDTNQAQVRNRCKRVLKGLGVEGYENATDDATKRKKAVGRVPMPVQAVQPNLLDVGAGAPAAPQTAPEDLLAGLTMVTPAAPEAAAPEGGTGFDFLQTPAPKPSPQPAPATADSAFSFLDAAPSSSPSGLGNGMDDLLKPMSSAPASTKPAAPVVAADPFADLMGASQKPAIMAAAAPTTSGFNFLSSTPATAAPNAATPAPAAGGMAQIQQAQQMFQMQQHIKMQQMQMMAMQQKMRGKPMANNSMMTGVRAAGSVKTMAQDMFKQQAEEDKKKKQAAAFSFVNDALNQS